MTKSFFCGIYKLHHKPQRRNVDERIGIFFRSQEADQQDLPQEHEEENSAFCSPEVPSGVPRLVAFEHQVQLQHVVPVVD